MTDAPSTTIGLLWHSVNSDNLGVGALTVAHIAIVDRILQDMGLEARFKVLGWRDPEPAYVTAANIEVVALRGRDLLRPRGLYMATRGCQIVLDISAGDSFADIYGARRFLFNILSKSVVLAARSPLILSPQTIGPFERWWARMLARLSMRMARKVVTRDAISSDYMLQLGLGHKLIEATDVAFRLPYNLPPLRPASPVRVGLNVSGLLFNGGYTRDNMFRLVADYPQAVRALCAHFTGLADCELHLIGHVNSRTNAVEDDFRVAEVLASEFPNIAVAPRFESPSAAKSYIAGLDFFAGARMHACIAAFSSGVPVVPMAYSRKFAGLFGTLGYSHLADCKSQSTEEIVRTVIAGFENREHLAKDVTAGLKKAEEKLDAYEDVLREHLRQIAGRN